MSKQPSAHEEPNGSVKYFTNRAIFLVNHPHLGKTTICRSLFKRSIWGMQWLSPYDECGHNANMQTRAKRAVRNLFPSQPVQMIFIATFFHHGLSVLPIKVTLFELTAAQPNWFQDLEKQCYVQLTEHQLCRRIAPLAFTDDLSLPAQ